MNSYKDNKRLPKTLDDNTAIKKLTINTTSYRGDYDMVFSFRERPVSDAFLRDLGLRLMAWADTDKKALKLNQFLRKNRIHRKTWDSWIKRNEDLEVARDFALMCLGDRREIGAITRKFSERIVILSMPNYDPDWRELYEWQARLKREPEDRGHVFNIIMEPIPSVESKP